MVFDHDGAIGGSMAVCETVTVDARREVEVDCAFFARSAQGSRGGARA